MRSGSNQKEKRRTRNRASCFDFSLLSFSLLVCRIAGPRRDDSFHGGSLWFVVVVCNGGLLLLFTEIVILLLLGNFGVTLLVIDGFIVVFTFQ